jgi:hypothetical protein
MAGRAAIILNESNIEHVSREQTLGCLKGIVLESI